MAQIKTQQYAGNTQTAEQKFAQAANSLNLKIFKAVSVIKEKVSKWTFKSSSRNHLLAETIMVQDARDRDLAKYGNSNTLDRLWTGFY